MPEVQDNMVYTNRYKTANGHIVEMNWKSDLIESGVTVSYGGRELLVHVDKGGVSKQDAIRNASFRADEVLGAIFAEALKQKRIVYYRPVSGLKEQRCLDVEADWSGDWRKGILQNGLLYREAREAIAGSLDAVLKNDERLFYPLKEGQFEMITSQITQVHYDKCRYDLFERVEGEERRLVLRPMK